MNKELCLRCSISKRRTEPRGTREEAVEEGEDEPGVDTTTELREEFGKGVVQRDRRWPESGKQGGGVPWMAPMISEQKGCCLPGVVGCGAKTW